MLKSKLGSMKPYSIRIKSMHLPNVRSLKNSVQVAATKDSFLCQQNITRRITAGLAAVVMTLSLSFSPLSLPAQAASNIDLSEQAMQEYLRLETDGKLKTSKALDDIRAKYKVKRLVDGRIQVYHSSGAWYSVRLDMGVPGTLLLREPFGGIYALQTGSLKQVDLSDDLIVLMLFADKVWEQAISPIEMEDEKGQVEILKLTEQQFRDAVGILNEEEDNGSKSGASK